MINTVDFKVFKNLLSKSTVKSITIDIDSCIINVEGHQEGDGTVCINKKILLILVTIFFISIYSITYTEKSTNYSLEYSRDMISKFVLNNYGISTNDNNLKFCNSKTIIGPNGNPNWKFSIQESERYLRVRYVYFDCISGYISGVSRYDYDDNIGTIIKSPNDVKNTLRDFIQYNYNIQVNLDNIQLITNYPVTRSQELVWEFTCKLSGNNNITVYVECETGSISGFKLDQNTEWFEMPFSNAHYIASDLLYSYNEEKLEPCQLFPIKDKEGNSVWKFSQTLDNKNYYIYVRNNNIEDVRLNESYIEDISLNKTYKVDYSSIEHKLSLFDKNYAKNLAMSCGLNYLGLQENNLTVNLDSDELESPLFNHMFVEYRDVCWNYSISDNVNSYTIFISACTGEVCEIYDSREKNYINPTINYTEAKSIAESFLKKVAPNKFQSYIFTGNSSIYAKGWTVFRYNRCENGVVYPNDVLMVYLNIDGSISNFYQTCNDPEFPLPYTTVLQFFTKLLKILNFIF